MQDEQAAPGFMLLQAVYRNGAPLDTADARRAALRGYVFAPFLAHAFLDDITPGEGRQFDVELLEDGVTVVGGHRNEGRARHEVKREVEFFGRKWTLVWRSTPSFEQATHSIAGAFVLFGGLLFTGLLAVLLLALDGRRNPVDSRSSVRTPLVLPLATAALIAGCGVGVFALLSAAETERIGSLVDEQARRIETTLDSAVRARLQTLRRMAHRWSSGDGTPYPVWRNDARDHIRHIAGFKELHWIGPDYQVHWAEGSWRVGWTGNRDLRGFGALTRALQASADSGAPFVTEPREITPGTAGFIIYTPLLRDGRFDGFLAAVFSSREFFGEAMQLTAGSDFAFKVHYGSGTYFDNGEQGSSDAAWRREGSFDLDDRRWRFEVTPTERFIRLNSTLLPPLSLAMGLLIAALAGFLVRYVLAARLKAQRLQVSAQALRESEERYSLAVRGMSVGLWDWNVTSNALYVSDRFREILGVRGEETFSHYSDLVSRVHSDDLAPLQAAISAHLRQRKPFDVEFRMRRSDGEYAWVHACAQAQYDGGGHAERMTGSLQDVTRQHQARQALERSASQLRLLVENAPAAVAMFDADMRYLMTSRRWLQDYGLEQSDIIGRCHYDVFPEIRNMPHWIEVHQRALRGERFDIREDSWIRANGQKEWNQWAIHPWIDAGGKVGGIVMFTEVITARKLAESALRTSEAMNRAAMDKAPIGKALVRPDGRFIRVNPALCRMLGYLERELLATDFHAVTHPEDVAADRANLRALLDGKVVSYQLEKRYLHRDGRVIWTLLSVSLVRNEDGAVDFLVAQMQDISDRKAAERMKDEFLKVMSHEIGGPLTVIRESLAMMGSAVGEELPGHARKLLRLSRSHCERLMTLMDQIHHLEEVAAGQVHFERRDASVADVVALAVEAGAPLAHENDAAIVVEPIDPSITVYVDPGRMVQALTNLLSNAAKFSPAGGEIHVGAELRDGSVRIHVRDSGEGIPEEFRSRIFGRFAQADTETARRKGGAGLGLHIARQLVEQMHGTVGFVSQPGGGATFWLEFPVVARRGAMRTG
jgi:PAS domain S-box-containing protein